MRNKKKILIVSDYIGNIGGIEVYIKNAGDLLKSDNYDIKYFGLKVNNQVKKYKQFLLLFVGANIVASIQLFFNVKKYKPDIVRYHSVSRYIGRLPIWTNYYKNIKNIIMYHDLGYFHPYPSKVTDESQILPLSLSNFIKMYTDLDPTNKDRTIKKILVGLKYFHIKLLSSIFKKNMDLYLVPSPFIKDLLQLSRGVDPTKIKVLSHFGPR